MKMASFKMYLTAVIALILGTLLSTEAQSIVPVLLWESRSVGESDVSPGALSKMNVEEFANVLIRRADRSPVVAVFVEDALSAEDFSMPSSGAHSAFPALKSLKSDVRLEFIPAVHTPAKALNRLSKLGYKWEQVSGEVLPDAGKKVLLVNLGDVKDGEDRPAMLHRHDKFIANMFRRMVAKYSDVLAIYTGKHASWIEPEPLVERVRRDTEPANPAAPKCDTVLDSQGTSERILLYTSECPTLTINNTNVSLFPAETKKPDSRKDVTRMVVRYKVGNSSDMASVRFRFNYTDDGYWELNQVEYQISNQIYLLDSKSNIKAPLNTSYNCGSVARFENKEGTVILKLKNIKVQPGAEGGSFASSVDCVPFFTIPIWSGLFVTFLLLFIVAWGIDMMMNIHTMDRFDDPKGKQLVFSAQE